MDKGNAPARMLVTVTSVLAAKRWASRWRMNRRRATLTTTTRPSQSTPKVNLQPTYQLEPKVKFGEFRETLHNWMTHFLEQRLTGMTYDGANSSTLCRQFSDDIKDHLKTVLSINRYKVVCHVCMGEKHQQALIISSRCLWSTEADGYVTATYENATLFCAATAYAIYCD
ncbi:dynein light chain Tctex-type protein 2B-like [Glandiceps talaboti]